MRWILLTRNSQTQCPCRCLLTEAFLCLQYSLRGSRWYYQQENQVAMDCWEGSVIIAKQLCNTLLAVPDRLSFLIPFSITPSMTFKEVDRWGC
jgi:hypothetical protein